MEACDIYSLFAFLLVVNFVLRQAFTWFNILNLYVLSKLFAKPKDFVKTYGKWAVVTGSSNGIGKNYARELAKKGLNVVLISNEEEKLHEVSKEIESSFNVETKVILADFSQGEEEYEKIFISLKDLDIGILVNNVGVAGGLPNKLEDMTRKQMWNIMMINICAATSMSHFILPKMKVNGRGLIVNTASLAAFAPTPFATLYGASKAYLRSFSDALKWECEGTGVEIQTLCPGFVDTKIIFFNTAMIPAMLLPTPEDFTKKAVDTLGKASTTSGCFLHDLQRSFIENLPTCFNAWYAKQLFQVKTVDEKKKAD